MVVPAAFSGLAAAYILGISRAVGETMIVAIAAGMQPNLTFNPLEPAATITAYIVQVALGDLPHGSIGYQTIFAAGLTLMLLTLVFNILGFWLRRRYREEYYVLIATSPRPTIRALIARQKRYELVFIVLGFLALSIAILTFVALFVDMLIDGCAAPQPRNSSPRFRRDARPTRGFSRPGSARSS